MNSSQAPEIHSARPSGTFRLPRGGRRGSLDFPADPKLTLVDLGGGPLKGLLEDSGRPKKLQWPRDKWQLSGGSLKQEARLRGVLLLYSSVHQHFI